MSDLPTVEGQQNLLRDAENAVKGYHDQYARRVIFAWFARMDGVTPFTVESDFCNDCSSGTNTVEAEFFWDGWGSLCAECSHQRFKHDGRNPRLSDLAERGRA